ncbi:hypothetical protein [Streptomyces chattanoogensis]|nr:hypothetical protein [Streptomyces chattanoogensis]
MRIGSRWATAVASAGTDLTFPPYETSQSEPLSSPPAFLANCSYSTRT